MIRLAPTARLVAPAVLAAWVALAVPTVLVAACGSTMQREPAQGPRHGDAPPSAAPRALLPPKTLALGRRHLCVIEGGEVFCRGAGDLGQLGNADLEDHDALIRVPGITRAERIAAGDHATCVVEAGGAITCWGSLGEAVATAPRRIGGVRQAVDIGLSRRRACAALADGTVTCWDGAGQSETIAGISDAVAITSGWFHSCARRADGRVSCFGGDSWGALGVDSPDATVIEVDDVRDAVSVDADAVHACAVQGDQTVACWGQPRPTVSGVRDAVAIGVGRSHACILHQGGLVSCVGEGTHGELGDGHRESSQTPVPVEDLSAVTELVVSGETSCARGADGFRCWGALWPFAVDTPGYRTRPSPLRRVSPEATPAPPGETPPPSIILEGASIEAAAQLVGEVFDVEVMVTAGEGAPLTGTLPPTSARAALRALAELAGVTYRSRTHPRVHTLTDRGIARAATNPAPAGAPAASPAPPTLPLSLQLLPCPHESREEAEGTQLPRALPCAPSDTLRLVGVAGGNPARALVVADGHGAAVVTLGTAVGAPEPHWTSGTRDTETEVRGPRRALSTSLEARAIGPRVVYLSRGPDGPGRLLVLGAPAPRDSPDSPRDF
ncbi:MAG: hypothetical protein DRJ42_19250 [Deltaproteobacteria bacterium]|nr:MAG: hypothetical protein DRJ42_19250 [Deltaproteobacteria bacterium]